MLTPPLSLGTVEAGRLFDFLYGYFHRDFVAQKTHLNQSIYVDPRSWRLDEGKEAAFWHLTTREQTRQVRQGNRYVPVRERLPDYARSERIEWVKQIIDNHNHASIKLFYYRENNSNRDVRLYLWAYQDDFVVILQKIGRNGAFLVTSFYIDQAHKRQDYHKRHQDYVSHADEALVGCEWF
ncbi:RlfB protein [Methylovulum psychrotolerans]|uniref:RlfB protein n=1 Tax=Methylovulum psychrotolerans TaxID=1704499 RepID=A0A2S5CQI0_9GAMM|nr:RlfB protein [Methylovulum psychrotolerans]POZ53048.1 hypothetical protein AADEFJLK_00057 [Methylovulum psychrotolerans]